MQPDWPTPFQVHILFKYDGYDFAGVEGVYLNNMNAEDARDIHNGTSMMDTFYVKTFKVNDMERIRNDL